VVYQANNTGAFNYRLEYAAMEVIFCEETRVAYGGKNSLWTYGVNPITMRTPGTLAASPTLAAGQYVATVVAPARGGSTSPRLAGAPPPPHAPPRGGGGRPPPRRFRRFRPSTTSARIYRS